MSVDIHSQMQSMLAELHGDWVLTNDGGSWILERGVDKKAVPAEVANMALQRSLIEAFRSKPGIVQYCLSASTRKA